MSVRYAYDIDDSRLLSTIKEFHSDIGKFIFLALSDSIREVRLRAAGSFMENTPGPHGDKLGTRTTRLRRAVEQQFSFAQGSTGNRDTYNKITLSSNTFKGEIGITVPYAAIHEYGVTVPARFIEPKNSTVLTWLDSGGERRFSKGHMVSGFTMPARPYMNPALEQSEDEIIEIFQRRMSELASRLS